MFHVITLDSGLRLALNIHEIVDIVEHQDEAGKPCMTVSLRSGRTWTFGDPDRQCFDAILAAELGYPAE